MGGVLRERIHKGAASGGGDRGRDSLYDDDSSYGRRCRSVTEEDRKCVHGKRSAAAGKMRGTGGEKQREEKSLGFFIPKTEREKTERSDGAGEPAEEEVQEQSSDGFPCRRKKQEKVEKMNAGDYIRERVLLFDGSMGTYFAEKYRDYAGACEDGKSSGSGEGEGDRQRIYRGGMPGVEDEYLRGEYFQLWGRGEAAVGYDSVGSSSGL